jgi:anaerobic selenocysteine-containing dehydrogenase
MAADWGAPWDYANRLMSAFGSPNCVGNGSVCFVGRDFAHTTVYGAMTMPDAVHSRCILIWGKNDLDTALGAAESILHAKRNGAKLIVVDPVRTRFAEMADIWLQIKPAHDGLLAMAMVNEIISRHLYDADFVERWTIGFEQLKESARKFPIDRIAPEIWLDPELVREAVTTYATVRPACIVDGNGLDMQLDSFDATRAVAMLRALTGNLDVPGGDLVPQPVPTRNIQLRERLPDDVEPVTADYPLFNRFHATWGHQVQSCVIDAVLDEKPYPIKALIVQSGNPLVTFMDAGRARRALEKVDFLVVSDLFMTRTAQMADVILPAATCFETTQLNRAGIRCSPVRIQEQVMEPLGESRPTWKIIFDLGRRLGLEDDFPWNTAEEAIDYQLEPSGVTVAMVRESPGGVAAGVVMHRKFQTEGFRTRSGKVEFHSAPLQGHGHDPVPYLHGFLRAPLSFTDQEDSYPLIGISGARTNRFVNSQYRVIPSLLQKEKGCAIDIHPADARRLGIGTGDQVSVESPRGRIRMKANVLDVIRPGVIRIAWGWGDYRPESSLNLLTDDDRRNPMTGAPSGRTFMCRVEKVGDGGQEAPK